MRLHLLIITLLFLSSSALSARGCLRLFRDLLSSQDGIILTKKERALYNRIERGTEYRTIGFRDKSHLEEHFEKHGEEFEYSSTSLSGRIRQYEEYAMAFAESTSHSAISYKDGNYVMKYDEKTNEFLAINEGKIKTYFICEDGAKELPCLRRFLHQALFMR